MNIKTRLGKLERFMSDIDHTGPYTCETCGRNQDVVFSITAPGEDAAWPRCPDCPAPRAGLCIVVEDGPVPVLPPPPVHGTNITQTIPTQRNP